MKCDQIAYYADSEETALEIKRMLGLADKAWVEDQVTGKVAVGRNLQDQVHGLFDDRLSVGRLQFNYDLGTEIEILTYLDGPHWHLRNPALAMHRSFLSHIGYHLDDDEEFPVLDASLVQVMETVSHTNPYVVERGRRYRYQIWDTRLTLGVYSKFIKRIRGANEPVADHRTRLADK